MGEPVQVCHIYPFALGIEAEWEKEKFWNILEIFWDLETVDRWKKDIIGPNGTEVPQNLLYLSTVVHDLWGSARLALNPLRCLRRRHHLQCVVLNLIAAMSGVVDVTDEELEEVSEGFSDDGDTVRETSEETSEEEEEEEDVLAYTDD
ncbi:unnamed protein product [Aspergillus oryzae var. brunneus]|uniref:Unnamed protein product n=1 Tax=Aspergillus oryzae var. brunneus TaxID=332754 RepID=A0ABQ6KS97_ASPOZ|nr:unnamed protein product [Aspergillus oryzae]GMG48293.1 unnamed protein product [Aspergillus oryzae var. brunneus]